MPWKNVCIFLLLVVLSGAVHIQKKHKHKRFVIEDKSIDGELNAKVLRNTNTGEYAEVVVDFGGRVEDLHLKSRSGKEVWPVLLTHQGNATAIKENVWSLGMLLLPWANRIAYGKYEFFDMTYQLPLNENTPTQQNALHGFMANKILKVDSTVETDSYARLELSYSFDGTEPGYPFLLDVAVFYTLNNKGFKVSFQISNRMENKPLPFFMGWHPYFVCSAYQAYVILDPCTKWNHVELNANMDPTGNTTPFHGFTGSMPIGGTETNPTFYDDEFKPVSGTSSTCKVMKTLLIDTETDHTVVLWQDGSFKFVHIFTGRGGDSIAIEPMSAAADAYNNHDHLTILSGGEVWTGSFGIYIE